MFEAQNEAQSQFTQAIPQIVDDVVPDPFQRGFYRARQAAEIGNTDTTDPYDFADTLIETSKQIAEYPMDADTQEALSRVTAPEQSFTGAVKEILERQVVVKRLPLLWLKALFNTPLRWPQLV